MNDLFNGKRGMRGLKFCLFVLIIILKIIYWDFNVKSLELKEIGV